MKSNKKTYKNMSKKFCEAYFIDIKSQKQKNTVSLSTNGVLFNLLQQLEYV